MYIFSKGNPLRIYTLWFCKRIFKGLRRYFSIIILLKFAEAGFLLVSSILETLIYENSYSKWPVVGQKRNTSIHVTGVQKLSRIQTRKKNFENISRVFHNERVMNIFNNINWLISNLFENTCSNNHIYYFNVLIILETSTTIMHQNIEELS